MELVVDGGNKVFAFDGSFGEQIWEPKPIRRFRFKNPVENEWLQEVLSANIPTAGIVFDSIPYIGTNDGCIYTLDKMIQRVPEIFVDPELFVDEYSFLDDDERQAFKMFKADGPEALDFSRKDLVRRVLDVDKIHRDVVHQEHSIDIYLRGSYSGIRGFVVDKGFNDESESLYDCHMLGITRTQTGENINELAPHAVYQLPDSRAGFVPAGSPHFPTSKIRIKDGILENIEVSCVDYRSLWNLPGQGRFVENICPRDGSGCSPGKFATDGEVVAISHGNHPFYMLDILERGKNRVHEKVKSLDLDPSKLPSKLLIRDGSVFGDYGNTIRNFSTEEDLFTPKHGEISSISDSGLCTVEDDGDTAVYDPLSGKQLDSAKGEYVFLPRAPQ
ncbi:hypothetical protein ACFL96_17840 [Thermoproteota archaeon]